MNGTHWVLPGNRVVHADLPGIHESNIRRECFVEAGAALCHPAARSTGDMDRQASACDKRLYARDGQ